MTLEELREHLQERVKPALEEAIRRALRAAAVLGTGAVELKRVAMLADWLSALKDWEGQAAGTMEPAQRLNAREHREALAAALGQAPAAEVLGEARFYGLTPRLPED